MKGKNKIESAVSTFTTEDIPPRWIILRGRIWQLRDIGGYRTEDGKRIRQGLLIRGEGLNANSVDEEIPGKNRLMVEDVKYLVEQVGIRTDLELRTPQETAGMKTSPLGPSVRFIHNGGAPFYRGIFSPGGMKMMAKNFRVFCNRENYPIYFHCIGGFDRTGSLAFVLCGVLGVSEQDLGIGWEHHAYPDLPDNRKHESWRRYQHLLNGIIKYGEKGDSMKKRFELYLHACGITQEEIETFRLIMLED